jgi:hypothetical protein
MLRRRLSTLVSAFLHVYTCDSAKESPYDSVYDFLHKLVCNLIFNRLFLISVDNQL